MYIYIYRERDTYVYTYIHVYIYRERDTYVEVEGARAFLRQTPDGDPHFTHDLGVQGCGV